jgi:hypothetical protein
MHQSWQRPKALVIEDEDSASHAFVRGLDDELEMAATPTPSQERKTTTLGGKSVSEASASLAYIARQAYIFAYPVVTMELTRRVMTNLTSESGTELPGHAPMGQFAHARHFPTAAFRDVTAPNADTLYSVAWVDLQRGPYLLQLPNMGNRYFLFPMLSAWTDVFANPGTRTTGNDAQEIILAGPSTSTAALKAYLTMPRTKEEQQTYDDHSRRLVQSPTSLVWILGRIYSTGTPDDYKRVHALQDQITLTNLDERFRRGRIMTSQERNQHAARVQEIAFENTQPEDGHSSTFGAGAGDARQAQQVRKRAQEYKVPLRYTTGYKATPRSTIDTKTPVRDQVHALSGAAFFDLFRRIVVYGQNPVALPRDQAMVDLFQQRLGIDLLPMQVQDTQISAAGSAETSVSRRAMVLTSDTFQHFEISQAIQDAAPGAQHEIMQALSSDALASFKRVNNWQYSTQLGSYTDTTPTGYLTRAATTAFGLGANLPEDAIYPVAQADGDGNPLSCAEAGSRYGIHFETAAQLPPVDPRGGFWSLTMYTADWFFVDNKLNRYTVSQRDRLGINSDGSIDIWISADAPTTVEKRQNWLPAPRGPFVLMLRLYWPLKVKGEPTILRGTWQPPTIEKLTSSTSFAVREGAVASTSPVVATPTPS